MEALAVGFLEMQATGSREIEARTRRAQEITKEISGWRHRLETAENRYRDAMEDLDQLRAEYEEDENEIVFEWQDKAQVIETYEVGLEKTDIGIDDVMLVWIPINR